MSKCKSPLWSHHDNSFNQTYKFEQKDVYTVEWLQFYSLVTGLKNFHFFTTHVEWPKTLFVLSGLIYILSLHLKNGKRRIWDIDYKFVSFSTIAAFFFSPYFLLFPPGLCTVKNLLLGIMGCNR